tara:strand:- start:113 stop:799 length:687 start_codon:yes stop_codon:yes gene_type:complete
MRQYVIDKQKKIPPRIHGVEIIIKSQPTNSINFHYIKKYLEKRIPRAAFTSLASITIADFDIFKKMATNALYDKDNNRIVLSSEQSNTKDALDDIIHELFHCVEERESDFLYSDHSLENEYIKKRLSLYRGLKAYNFNPPPKKKFTNTEYDFDLDEYLTFDVGYKKLFNFTSKLFISNYSATSLSEYCAEGFESFYFKPQDHHKLKKISPRLFEKISKLHEKLSLQGA